MRSKTYIRRAGQTIHLIKKNLKFNVLRYPSRSSHWLEGSDCLLLFIYTTFDVIVRTTGGGSDAAKVAKSTNVFQFISINFKINGFNGVNLHYLCFGKINFKSNVFSDPSDRPQYCIHVSKKFCKSKQMSSAKSRSSRVPCRP